MKRIIAFVLCLGMLSGVLMGCGSEQKQEKPEVTAPEETEIPEETATPEATSELEEEETEEVIPIELEQDLVIPSGLKIAVVASETDAEYWRRMKNHMKKAVAAFNEVYELKGEDAISMTFEGPDDDAKVDEQINMIDAVLSENPSVLCLAAIDMESCQAQLETAMENDIPVIAFDTGVKSDLVTTFCATDNKKAGSTAAKEMANQLEDGGEIAIFAHRNTSHSSMKRVDGFKEEIEKNYKNLKIVYTTYENSEESMADMVAATLDENPEISGVFCTDQSTTDEVLAYMKKNSQRKLVLAGFDAGKSQQKAVKNGTQLGFVAQDTYTMAFETIQAAIKAVSASEGGAKPERTIAVPYAWIDKNNIEMKENEKFLTD